MKVHTGMAQAESLIVKTDRKEIPWEGMEWIDVTQKQVTDCC
jgi:hypothetical protein